MVGKRGEKSKEIGEKGNNNEDEVRERTEWIEGKERAEGRNEEKGENGRREEREETRGG